MDERRITRRVFFGDLWFLGGGLVASVAWAWANMPTPQPPVATPESPTPPVATDPKPSPSPSVVKKRPDEMDYPDRTGGAVAPLPQ